MADRLDQLLRFLQHHKEFVRRIMYKLGVSENTEQEDLQQNVWWRFLRKANEEMAPNSLKAYLIKITRSEVLNYLRERFEQSEISIDEIIEMSDERQADPEEVFLAGERMRELGTWLNAWLQAVAQLPPDLQNVYRLIVLDHQSFNGAAEQLRSHKSTVEDQFAKARWLIHLWTDTNLVQGKVDDAGGQKVEQCTASLRGHVHHFYRTTPVKNKTFGFYYIPSGSYSVAVKAPRFTRQSRDILLGATLLQPEDLINPASLWQKLQGQPTVLSQWLPTRSDFMMALGDDFDEPLLRQVLVEKLNLFILGPSRYDPEVARRLRLPAYVRQLMAEHLSSAQLQLINRLLLEVTYSGELVPSRRTVLRFMLETETTTDLFRNSASEEKI